MLPRLKVLVAHTAHDNGRGLYGHKRLRNQTVAPKLVK